MPTWDDIVNRPYDPWPETHWRFDTSRMSAEQCIADILGSV